MYCPKCGKQLPDDARFCGACGTPLPGTVTGGSGKGTGTGTKSGGNSGKNKNGKSGKSTGAKSGGKNKKKKKKSRLPVAALIAAVVVVIAVVAGAVAFFVFGGGGSGDSLLPDPVTKTIEALTERDEAAAFLQEYAEAEGTIGITVSAEDTVSLLTDLGMSSAEAAALDAAFTIDLAVSQKDKDLSLSLDVDLLGEALSADLYLSAETLTVSAPYFFDDIYTIDLETAAEDLEDSVFSTGSSDYSLAYSDYITLLEALEDYEELLSDDSLLSASELVEEYVDELEDEGLMPVFEEEKTTVTVGGEEVSCTAHTAEIDGRDLADILDFTEDYLEDHLGSRAILMLEEMDIYVEDLSEMADELEDTDLTFTVEYDVKNQYMIRFAVEEEVTYSSGSTYSAGIEIDFGTDPASTGEVVLSILDDGDVYYQYTLELGSDSDESWFTLSYAMLYRDIETTLIDYTRDTDDGSFVIYSGSVIIRGTAEVSGSTLTLTDLRASNYSGYSLGDLEELTIVLDQKAEVSKIKGSTVNFLTLSEDELEDLIAEVSANGDDLYTMLYAILN